MNYDYTSPYFDPALARSFYGLLCSVPEMQAWMTTHVHNILPKSLESSTLEYRRRYVGSEYPSPLFFVKSPFQMLEIASFLSTQSIKTAIFMYIGIVLCFE